VGTEESTMHHGVKSAKLRALFHSGWQLKYQKHETILRARETPRGVYLIDDGLIKIYSLSKRRNEHVHHIFGPGDYFPIIWPFRDSIRSLYYETLCPTTVWLIPRDTFRDFVYSHPDIMKEILEELIDRYNTYGGRIDNLLYSDVRERSAYRLLSLASRFGVETKEGVVIDAAITHTDLAHSINTTRETFGRTLSRLQQRGVIAYDEQRRIVIRDMTALAHIIGEDEARAMWPEFIKYAF
jgi:CRP/FNR family transcriptional regulator